ncbi:MAG TPA: hypothetical protein VGJ97_00825, partial [Anaerolineaceae bacterium]
AVPLLFVTILLWVGAGKYYEKTFGFGEPRADQVRKVITGLLLALFYAGFFLIETNAAGGGLRPYPVSLSGIFVGILFIGIGRSSHRVYYQAFGLLLAGESLLPIFIGRTLSDPVFGALGLLFGITFGLGLLVISIVDHIRLVRGFHPLHGGSHAGSA